MGIVIEEIKSFVDILLSNATPTPDAAGQTEIQPYPTASAGDAFTPAAASGGGMTLPWYPTPAISAARTGGTPVAPEDRGTWQPELFVDDIVLTGPDTASATARYIDNQTGEEISIAPIIYTFVKVDGRWLLDSYADEAR